MENAVFHRLLEVKKKLKKTDIEFTSMLGVSTGTLHRIRNNENVSEKMLDKICTNLGVSTQWLLNGEGELEMNIPIKEEVNINPYKDALVKELKEEVDFLRQLLKNITGTSQTVRANFNTDTVPALDCNEILSLQFGQYRESA